jgi:hypothetical protein
MTSKTKPKVFLFQSGGASPHPNGPKKFPQNVIHPLLTRVAGLMTWLAGYYPNVCDNTNIQRFIYEQRDSDGNPSVNYIVTRPFVIQYADKVNRSDVELEGTEDSFTFATIKNTELARFSLKSLDNESLYGKMPFIHLSK